MGDSPDPWDRTYATRSATELSWYERDPTISVRLIESVAPGPSSAIVDIGAGTSFLVDRLLEHGYADLTVLDIAEHALAQVRARLGDEADRVQFVRHDVLTWESDRRYDVLHDRAVFHFLTDPGARGRYATLAARVLYSGGALVIATFRDRRTDALLGPTRLPLLARGTCTRVLGRILAGRARTR